MLTLNNTFLRRKRYRIYLRLLQSSFTSLRPRPTRPRIPHVPSPHTRVPMSPSPCPRPTFIHSQNLPTLRNDSSFAVQFSITVSKTRAILLFKMKIQLIEMFELHERMPGISLRIHPFLLALPRCQEGFCTLCFCFPAKMLHLNAPFFPLKCSVSLKKSLKCSDNAVF